jgi:tRNA-splicing ligase RtcB (3'-phosphate/5'-hydroxy nucleic acid ligase)
MFESIESAGVPIEAWTRGVPIEEKAKQQLRETASLPIVWPHLAVMPDVHWGMGSTVGSVVPTINAIIPSCVGVDIGCGMAAVRTTLTSSALGDNALALFSCLERAIPHGRTDDGGANDRGAWGQRAPEAIGKRWDEWLNDGFDRHVAPHIKRAKAERAVSQLGTLGTGNHFVEVCIDESDRVWLMLHSGSRGIGNQIASHFIAVAKRRADEQGTVLPNRDLAWLDEGTPEFGDYVAALDWAQRYARTNRDLMLGQALYAMRVTLPAFDVTDEAVNCHHNYVNREQHFGRDVWLTRKGAVSARAGELGIIPGSMGTKSFIVRGRGNPDSFNSCSHGAGRVMARGEAKRNITVEQHALDTAGVVCRKDADVVDESPRAYKNVEDVLRAQRDLIDVVHVLKQAVCVKG